MNEFLGKWRITHMGLWAQNMVNLVAEGYFNFDENEQGKFSFCAIKTCAE